MSPACIPGILSKHLELLFKQFMSHERIILISTATFPSTSACRHHTAIVSTIRFFCLVAIAWHTATSLYLADRNQGPSPLATVSPSESPAISNIPPALKDEHAGIGTSPTPANDDTAQPQIQPRPGILKFFLVISSLFGDQMYKWTKIVLRDYSSCSGSSGEPGELRVGSG